MLHREYTLNSDLLQALKTVKKKGSNGKNVFCETSTTLMLLKPNFRYPSGALL